MCKVAALCFWGQEYSNSFIRSINKTILNDVFMKNYKRISMYLRLRRSIFQYKRIFTLYKEKTVYIEIQYINMQLFTHLYINITISIVISVRMYRYTNFHIFVHVYTYINIYKYKAVFMYMYCLIRACIYIYSVPAFISSTNRRTMEDKLRVELIWVLML